jgi:hypothetical protein
LGTKTSVESQHLRTCNDDGPKRPIETQCLFVAEYRLALRLKNGKPHQSPSVQNRKIGSDCSFHASEPLENYSFSDLASARITLSLISFLSFPACSFARCLSSPAFKALCFSARLRRSQEESRLLGLVTASRRATLLSVKTTWRNERATSRRKIVLRLPG